jgi:Zn-dependent protease with chaperone function
MTDTTTAVPARSSPLQGDAAPALAHTAPEGAVGSPLTEEQIRLALSGKIEPVRSTPLYRLWIAVVAAVMVLLPLIYLSIIAVLVAGLIYHATHNVTLFQSLGRGRNAIKAALALYVSPLVIGGVVVLFMLKPFFARPVRREKLRVLDRASEPRLHALVDGICAAVGSPRPARIEVNCDVNASAHREGWFLGLFGSRLVLTIGMPLAAGLSLKQFTGVLAHEFGHFSQGAGMRLCTLIRRVNMWFARVVYERDAWDQRLETISANDNGYIKILGGLTRLAVWLTRRVLWALMWVGHLVSSFLSRQMEFDADCYEARMVGGPVFAATSWQLRVMSVAQNGAYHDLGTSWNERRLPDDFSKLVLANVPQLPDEMIKSMRTDVEKSTTGWFESHPCDRDRISRAMVEAPGEGIFRLDGPSSAVFNDLDELSRFVSLDYYRSIVDEGIRTEQLFSVADLVESQANQKVGQAAAERFFLGSISLPKLSLELPERLPEVPGGLEAFKQAIVESRNDQRAARDAHLDATKRREDADSRLLRMEYAIVALGAGLKIDLGPLGLESSKVEIAVGARDRILEEIRGLDRASAPFAAAAARRLALDLGHLELDGPVDLVPDAGARRREAQTLYPCLSHLGRIYHRATEQLVARRSVLLELAGSIEKTKNPESQPFDKAFQSAGAGLAAALEELRALLGDSIAYPFEHAEENMTLGRFILGDRLPEKDDLNGLVQASYNAINSLSGLYFRALGRLSVIAEAVEKSIGLCPIAVEERES